MADKLITLGPLGQVAPFYLKYRDLGDGSHAMAVSNEGVASSRVSSTSFSNASLASLVTAVNAYLAGSTKKFSRVTWFTDGLVSLTFYALIDEVT